MIYFLLKCFYSSNHLLKIKLYWVRTYGTSEVRYQIRDPESGVRKRVGLVRGPKKKRVKWGRVRFLGRQQAVDQIFALVQVADWYVFTMPKKKKGGDKSEKEKPLLTVQGNTSTGCCCGWKLTYFYTLPSLFRCASSGKIVPKGAARWRWDTLR